MLQVLLNIMVFGMSPQEAVEAPRFQTEHFYASFADHQFVPGKLNLEGRISKETASAPSGTRSSSVAAGRDASAPTMGFCRAKAF